MVIIFNYFVFLRSYSHLNTDSIAKKNKNTHPAYLNSYTLSFSLGWDGERRINSEGAALN